jgi:YidC/Oxa1 family membrane protein insertase
LKKLTLFISFLLISILLTGCSASGNDSGLFHTILINPMTKLIEFFANISDGNFGISIVIMTLLIRLLLLPLTMKQTKSQTQMKGKMETAKPEMAAIQKQLKETKDPVKQKELQQEMMKLYQKHGINPLNIGCLPLLIQMPILMGFYYAIKGSHEIATHNFLWFNLGHVDHIMAIIAGIIYYLQFRFSLQQMPAEQQNSMKYMGLLSPVMILFVSFSAPAALPVYWSIGGLFMIVQSIFLRRLYQKQDPNVPAAVPHK